MFFNQNVEDVLLQTKSTKYGLTSSEADSRKDPKNLNKLQDHKRTSIFKKFLSQFSDVMVIVLLISAVISISMALIKDNKNDLFEGIVILFIVLLNASMGVIQENKAENALENLKRQVEPTCKVFRDKEIMVIKTEDLVVGDVVILETGNIVPADLRLIETHNLKINEASLTGESVAVEKDAKNVVKNAKVLADQTNMAFSNTVVTVGRALGVVVRIGKSTEMGKIANLLTQGKKETTPLQKSLNKIGKIISYSVIAISIIIFFVELFVSKQIGFMGAFMSAVALAVAAIPESLPAVITVIMAMGVQSLAKKNAIIKRLHAVETLGNCQIICSDKTGTLTQNKMIVEKVVYNFCRTNCNLDTNDFVFKELVNCMVLCNDCYIKKGEIVGEPTEKALIDYAINKKIKIEQIKSSNKRICEVPFTSERKMMSVIVEKDEQIICYTKGAVDTVLERCKYVFVNGKRIILSNSIKQDILNKNTSLCNSALRVIAFAERIENQYEQNHEQDLTFIGLVGMIDPPRPEVYSAVKKCFDAGLKPIMITGDHKSTAYAIAKQIGIAHNENQVLTGHQLSKMTDLELENCLHKFTVFARVNPEHKVKIVKAFKKSGKIVAMTGDGVNDAPSLKIADIGIGMGIMGTQVTKDVADMIIADDNFATIISAVEEGRKIYSNIQKTIQFLLSTNAVEVVTLFLACIFFPNFVFLIPSQILFINFITDSLPAIGLGMEKAEKEIMQRPPHKNNNIIDKRIGFNIFYQASIQIFIVLVIFILGLKCYNNAVASTMVFFVINYMQIIHSINLKTNNSLKSVNLLNNKIFNITFLIGMLLITSVAVVPSFRIMLGLVSLNTEQWVIVFIASISIIPIVEICKKILRMITYERIK